MRIAIVSGTFHPEAGGPPTYLYRLAATLVARGHRVRVATYGEPDPPASYPYPVGRVSRRQPIPARLARLTLLAARDLAGADLVFVSDYGLPPTLANLLARRPLVMKIVSDFAWEFGVRHGLVPADTNIDAFQRLRLPARLALVRTLQRLYARRADAVIVPSAYLAGLVAGWGVAKARLRIIPNAVEPPPTPAAAAELRARLGIASSERLVVTVARLTPWKRVDLVIGAVARLRGEGPPPRLVIVGDGEERAALVRQAAALGLRDTVRFVGEVPQPDVAAYLGAADAFALASTYEGFSHVLLEAMAAQAPVVATAVGGNREVITSGENGLLAPPNDADALAEALRRVLDDSVLAARLRAGGARTLAAYRWERVYAQTEALLREVARGCCRGARA